MAKNSEKSYIHSQNQYTFENEVMEQHFIHANKLIEVNFEILGFENSHNGPKMSKPSQFGKEALKKISEALNIRVKSKCL